MYLIGYDIGSSSIKASLIDAPSGKVLASASCPQKEMVIIAKQPGWAEQDPQIWWQNVKASDEFLDRLFAMYFQQLGLPNLMRKADYHVLARLVPKDLIDDEIREKLDVIVRVAKSATPAGEQS